MLCRLRIENLVLIREAELDLSPGLNAVTGETGAGKTIFAQAIGLLLGTKADAGAVGPSGEEAYVEAEFAPPDGFWAADDVRALAELRPQDEPRLVVSRRVFGDGRTRAYAWGRAVAREDMAAAVERLIAMSGQFEQRRLARPAYQLDVLDAFCGPEQAARREEARRAWRVLVDARRRHEDLTRDAGAAAARLEELRALVDDTAGMHAGEEEALRGERERLRHVSELAEGAIAAAWSIDPEDGDGAAALASAAERALAPLEQIAPELAASAYELRDVAVRLREVGTDLHRFVSSLDADPGRLDEVEARLELIADARRRFRCQTFEELVERREAARLELELQEDGRDPVEAAAEDVALAEAQMDALAHSLRAARRAVTTTFADAVAERLRDVGMGAGEFRVELRERDVGPKGREEAVFLIRPNAGMPFGLLAETASGGELSRVALAIAAVAGGETLVFDEIDAGIGGTTAHRVAKTLGRLAERAQVIAITHLPQIASAAERHFRVEKVPGDPTHTRIELLAAADQRSELERMLGGQDFLATLAHVEETG